ncbi:DUF177 domain-containing protein [Burkholderiaceae bacterium DAT-1]|nr:DUF177 domain-containing protein [Burkholderiaceae bacterium DAT-1]
MSDLVFDNADFCRQNQTREGTLSLEMLPRVAESALSASSIQYGLAGGTDWRHRKTIDVRIVGELQLTCQRCMKVMPFEVDVTSRFTLFKDEAALDAAELEDEDLEGLLIEQEFNALALIEDEILLTLPYAPAHDACENPDMAVEQRGAVPEKPNPFAVLAGLKGKLKSGDQ